jgi:uncharacterized protein
MEITPEKMVRKAGAVSEIARQNSKLGPAEHEERTMLKNLIKEIAKALVDQPEEVSVIEIEGEQTSVIELKVAKEDLGKVIGKQGRNARAIRTILSAASTKLRKRAVLEIIE